jgi:MFS family permease
MKQTTLPEGRRFYYGWVIVGLAMLSMAYWFGLRTSFSVFFVALTDQFHWGRAEAAAALSIAMVAYMVMAPIVGILVDRIGPRRVMLPGIALTGLGLLLCTQIETLTQFYLFYGVVAGIGIPCLSIAPFTIILSHWFERKRGTANGLASVGMGMSSLLFVPLFQYLISLWGWRSSFFIFSLLVLAIPLPLNAIFLKHRPEDIGLLPDGDSMDDMPKEAAFHPVASSLKKQGLKDLMKTGRFWSVILFPSLIVFGIYIVIVHHVRYLVDLGVGKMWAASLFAVMGAISGGFRFLWGWLSDRIGREITYTLGGICFSLGILPLLLFQYIPSPLLLYLFAFFFGAGWGSTAPIFMSISGDLYKGKNFGLIYGMVEGNIGVGAAVGTWVGGYIFDQTKNYLWAFILAILISFISVLLVWYIAPRKFRPINP